MDFKEVRKALQDGFLKNLDVANNLWYDLLRLLITLSSSFLVLTLAFVEKLFPSAQSSSEGLSVYLIIAWLAFFFAIVFSLIAIANEVIFQGNEGRNKADMLKDLDQKNLKNEKIDLSSFNLAYYRNNTIYWGVVAYDSFLIAIPALCLALLENLLSQLTCIMMSIIFVLLLLSLNIFMLSKRRT